MWAPLVWCCVTDFSSLTVLLEYLAAYKIRAQSLSPDGKYLIIFNFVKTCHEPLDFAYRIFDQCVVPRLNQQTRFFVPVESVGANRVPIVPEDSGSHRYRVITSMHSDGTFANYEYVCIIERNVCVLTWNWDISNMILYKDISSTLCNLTFSQHNVLVNLYENTWYIYKLFSGNILLHCFYLTFPFHGLQAAEGF